jgi:hypothetical protein
MNRLGGYQKRAGESSDLVRRSAIQTVGGGRKAGGRQERRDEGNSTLEWGVLRRVAAVS